MPLLLLCGSCGISSAVVSTGGRGERRSPRVIVLLSNTRRASSAASPEAMGAGCEIGPSSLPALVLIVHRLVLDTNWMALRRTPGLALSGHPLVGRIGRASVES